MAFEASDQGKPEGLVFAPGGATQSRLSLDQYGFQMPHTARVLHCSSYDTFSPPVYLTPEQGCHNYGDNCSAFASPGSGFSWPAVFLSPAKAQGAGTDMYTQMPSCDLRARRPLVDRDKRRRVTGGCLLRAHDFSAFGADCSLPQHQYQQHELQRHVHRRHSEQRRQASDLHAGQISLRDNEADGCLERPANYTYSYGRSLLRLVLEKGRRTLQRRRKRIRHPKNAANSKNQGSATEMSIRAPAGAGFLIRGVSGAESACHIHSLTERVTHCDPIASLRSSINDSPRTTGCPTVENIKRLSYMNNGLAASACSPQCDTAEETCSMHSPAQYSRQKGLKRESDDVQDSSAVYDLGTEHLQPLHSRACSREAFVEKLPLASPDNFQDIHLCLPEPDPPQLLPQRRLSQTAVLFPSREIQWYRDRIDHPCLAKKCSSQLMASDHAYAKVASKGQSSVHAEAEEARKEDATPQNMERMCSARSSVAASKFSDYEYGRSTGCGDRKPHLNCAPAETGDVCVDYRNLHFSAECTSPAGSCPLESPKLQQTFHLAEPRALFDRPSTGFRSRRWRCVPCLRCSQHSGEICCLHSRNSQTLNSARRAGAVKRASTTNLCPHLLRKRNTLQAPYHVAYPAPAFLWKAASCAYRSFNTAQSHQFKPELSPLAPTSPSGAYYNFLRRDSLSTERSSAEPHSKKSVERVRQSIQSRVVHGDVSRTVASVQEGEYGRKGSLSACESPMSRFVHDTRAMKWISKERLMDSIADALTALVDRSDSVHNKEARLPRIVRSCFLLDERNRKFDGIRCPSITVRDYYYRIAALCSCSCSCHLLALIYMDRLQQSVHNLFFDVLNIHRWSCVLRSEVYRGNKLCFMIHNVSVICVKFAVRRDARIVITSIMCAAKFYDDTFLSNAHYAMVGGISLREMNRLEVRFLSMINFRLTVLPEHFGAYLSRLGCIGPQTLQTYTKAHERHGEETTTAATELS